MFAPYFIESHNGLPQSAACFANVIAFNFTEWHAGVIYHYHNFSDGEIEPLVNYMTRHRL